MTHSRRIGAATADEAALDAAAELPPLVMRCGAFGDIVLLTVLLRQLHARFGKPVDVISSGPWTKELLDGQTSLGRLFIIRSRRTPYWMSLDQQRLVAWLRKRGAGPTWFCDRDLGMDLLRRGRIPAEYICDSRKFAWVPEEGFADRFIRLANETPAAFVGRLPAPHAAVTRAAQLVLTAAARAEADDWLARRHLTGRPFIVIHPGSRHIARRGLRSRAGSDKYWPEARWGQVIKTVRDLRPDHVVLLSGTPKERRFNADIMVAAAATDVHNVADDLPIRTLLPVLERAHSMISVDTGPAHAAAALGCPTVALFGTAPPVLYRPGGATTPAIALTGTVNGVQNILGITAESVIAAWFDLIRSAEMPAVHSVKSLTCD
ncbi:MAG: glycosyltransferase family 9 protein [Steroidobacteraceae bacterium]